MDIKDSINNIEDVYQAAHEVTNALKVVWLKDLLWTWQWWFGVALAIVPWIIWFIFRKKNSTSRLLLAGGTIMLVASWFDFMGVSLGLWSYSVAIIPTIPTFIPWDFSLIPVTTMFVLQIKPNLNPFIKAVFIAGVTSYIGEPFFKWIGVYDPKEWKYIYSFVIYIGIYLLAHFISRRKTFERL